MGKNDNKSTRSEAAATTPVRREAIRDGEIIDTLKLMMESNKQMMESSERNMKLIVEHVTSTVTTSIKESFSSQVQVMQNEMFNFKKDQDELIKANNELRKRLDTMEARNAELVNRLETAYNQIDDLEQSQRRTSLMVNNLAPVPGKTDEELFLDLCKNKMEHLNVTRAHIARIHRLSRPSSYDNNKPPSLVVKFAQDKFRDSVFKNKKNLKGSNVVISESLTKRRSMLLKSCIDRIPGNRDTRSVWTDNGRILVKIGQSNIIQIHSEADIDRLINENFPLNTNGPRQ